MSRHLVPVLAVLLLLSAGTAHALAQGADSNDPAETPVPDGPTVRLELLVDGSTSRSSH